MNDGTKSDDPLSNFINKANDEAIAREEQRQQVKKQEIDRQLRLTQKIETLKRRGTLMYSELVKSSILEISRNLEVANPQIGLTHQIIYEEFPHTRGDQVSLKIKLLSISLISPINTKDCFTLALELTYPDKPNFKISRFGNKLKKTAEFNDNMSLDIENHDFFMSNQLRIFDFKIPQEKLPAGLYDTRTNVEDYKELDRMAVEYHKTKLELYENNVLPKLKANALSVVTHSIIHLLQSYIQLRDEQFPKSDVKRWDFHLERLCKSVSDKINVRDCTYFTNKYDI